MNLWKRIFKGRGWRLHVSVSLPERCVICVAPHTSNWDFIIGLLAYKSIGRDANFLMKKFWFFWPLGPILRSLGGIPVDRSKGHSLTSVIIDRFRTSSYLNLAVTPEGTRKAVRDWKTGFLRIAQGAGVPVVCGIIDYRDRIVRLEKEFPAPADIERSLVEIKDYYRDAAPLARHPDGFIV